MFFQFLRTVPVAVGPVAEAEEEQIHGALQRRGELFPLVGFRVPCRTWRMLILVLALLGRVPRDLQ